MAVFSMIKIGFMLRIKLHKVFIPIIPKLSILFLTADEFSSYQSTEAEILQLNYHFPILALPISDSRVCLFSVLLFDGGEASQFRIQLRVNDAGK
jgi:hypothetical protein